MILELWGQNMMTEVQGKRVGESTRETTMQEDFDAF